MVRLWIVHPSPQNICTYAPTDMYTWAIAGAPTDATLYGNRCLARIKAAEAVVKKTGGQGNGKESGGSGSMKGCVKTAGAVAAGGKAGGVEGKENASGRDKEGDGGKRKREMLELALADAERAIAVLVVSVCVMMTPVILSIIHLHRHQKPDVSFPPFPTPARTHAYKIGRLNVAERLFPQGQRPLSFGPIQGGTAVPTQVRVGFVYGWMGERMWVCVRQTLSHSTHTQNTHTLPLILPQSSCRHTLSLTRMNE